MIDLNSQLQAEVIKALKSLYLLEIKDLELQQTRKDFVGDVTLVVFPYLKASRKGPEQTSQEIGEYLKEHVSFIADFNVIKGFLNLVIADTVWLEKFGEILKTENYGKGEKKNETIMVEYSSPNTNKPLHLGHVRNILLGYSVSEILKAAGKDIIKTQIINDRGIHICKSMLAWQRWGNGETPDSTGVKGDKLVGNYYVKFDQEYKKEIESLVNEGLEEKEAKEQAPIILAAREMLKKWEQGDEEVVALWKKMNGWVYDGFDKTYKTMGVDFQKLYYESDTYLLGKKVVEEGLAKGVFEKDPDGSVWIDLTAEGLDRKILLRSDGTSVYMTQDIGTAIQRAEDFAINGMIYTVGNEQDYHFKVLFIILKKLGYAWAEHLYHLSYGMVDLPTGKMKSREGTVVDADDLMQEQIDTAKEISEELGKTEGMTEEEKTNLYNMVGMGALKYFILKVDPKKRMMFNPAESIDFQGNTGPFIQYTHARIKSLLRRAEKDGLLEKDFNASTYTSLAGVERELIKFLVQFPEVVQVAAEELSPAQIANYTYDLVKAYNAFYQQLPIFTDENESAVLFRIHLSAQTAEVVKMAMGLLGITVPKRM